MEKARRWPNRSEKTKRDKISIALYAAAVPLAFVQPWIASVGYVIVAVMWLVPDRRIEREVADK